MRKQLRTLERWCVNLNHCPQWLDLAWLHVCPLRAAMRTASGAVGATHGELGLLGPVSASAPASAFLAACF